MVTGVVVVVVANLVADRVFMSRYFYDGDPGRFPGFGLGHRLCFDFGRLRGFLDHTTGQVVDLFLQFCYHTGLGLDMGLLLLEELLHPLPWQEPRSAGQSPRSSSRVHCTENRIYETILWLILPSLQVTFLFV